MRQAFTLVEIAYVIVIIGIISTMVFKGKGIIDSAMMRKEISKISHLVFDFAKYFAVNNDGLDDFIYESQRFGSDILVRSGYVDLKTIECKYCEEQDVFYKATAVRFNSDNIIDKQKEALFSFAIVTGKYINDINSDYYLNATKVACSWEVIMDDKNPRAGSARYFYYPVGGKNNYDLDAEDAFDNCLGYSSFNRYAYVFDAFRSH